jgi:hypothetical protein
VPHEDSVSNGDPIANKRMALNLAIGAYGRAALNLDERPHTCAVPDPAAVEVGERADHDSFTKRHVADQSMRRFIRWLRRHPGLRLRLPAEIDQVALAEVIARDLLLGKL